MTILHELEGCYSFFLHSLGKCKFFISSRWLHCSFCYFFPPPFIKEPKFREIKKKIRGEKLLPELKTYDISLTNERYKFHWIEPIHWESNWTFVWSVHSSSFCNVHNMLGTLFSRQGEIKTWTLRVHFFPFLRLHNAQFTVHKAAFPA